MTLTPTGAYTVELYNCKYFGIKAPIFSEPVLPREYPLQAVISISFVSPQLLSKLNF
jgi:hypothetical protein